ncbi:enoyl-CoA hydratase/isomerase family protein [Aquipuribacter sp. SD81]|uniref:enoyl-CoA hydratase/isomerase family protein n=1 Tax=Aquipuribacter sp. SD81 TaxID=3127703 RepID=UPI0030191908
MAPPEDLEGLLATPPPRLVLRRDDEDPSVVVVALADPARRNAMGTEMTASWRRVVAALSRDTTLRALVLTATGSAFSSGGDLAWLRDGAGAGADVGRLRERMARYYDDWLSLLDVPVPVVAAAPGPAVGAGAGLLLACDLRLLARSAYLAVPFTALGLHPGMGLTSRLPELAGPTVAADLLLTGRRIGAEEAARHGLASEVHDDDGLLTAALDRARTVAARAPLATRLTTATLRAPVRARLRDALRREALAQARTLATADAAAGLEAAAGRRAPVFTGR